MTLPTVDVRKTVAPAAKVARDAAYVAVGLGVIATQKATARRYDIEQRVKEVAPRVRDEAKATAERVMREANDTVVRVRDEATQRVRNVVDRRKAATAAETTPVA
jgi:gas vesicle protein